jgi:hypothetical protein
VFKSSDKEILYDTPDEKYITVRRKKNKKKNKDKVSEYEMWKLTEDFDNSRISD